MGDVINKGLEFTGLGSLDDRQRSGGSSGPVPVSEFDRLLKGNDFELSELNLEQFRQRAALQNALLFGQPLDGSIFPDGLTGSAIEAMTGALDTEGRLSPLRQQLAFRQLQSQLGLTDQGSQLAALQLGAGTNALGIQGGILDQLTGQVSRNDLFQNAVTQNALNTIGGGFAPTEQQQANLNQQFGSLLDAGNQQIDFNTQRALEQIREVTAPARGLSTRDTPIQDRFARVAEAGVLQKGQLQSNLAAQQAQAELNLPLQTAQIFGGLGNAAFNQNLGTFGATQAPIATGLQQQGLNFDALRFGQQFSPGLTSAGPALSIGQGLGFLQPIQFQGAQFGNQSNQFQTAGSIANQFGNAFAGSFGKGLGGGVAGGVGSFFS